MSQPLCLLGASVCVGILKDGFTIHAVRIIDKRGITRRLYLFQLIKRKRSLENVAFLFFSWMKKIKNGDEKNEGNMKWAQKKGIWLNELIYQKYRIFMNMIKGKYIHRLRTHSIYVHTASQMHT